MDHTAENVLESKLDSTLKYVSIGSKYVHYKNPDNEYIVVAVGLNEENEEPCIVYEAQYGKNLVWIRTYDNFMQEIEFNGKKVFRFQKI